jgi:NAD-dependent dihydropyrimidine dehydrogenase PreA subunit
MTVNRKIIQIDEELCNGCANCIIACAEGALELIDGKAKLVSDVYCDGLGACLGDCPTGALKIIERAADEFDEAAVENRLHALKQPEAGHVEDTLPCGCPSTRLQTFDRPTPCEAANEPAEFRRAASALAQWPIQIRLVPPTAPFLKNADLLVAADCTPFAYANFHQELLAGKTLMIGCPKFDDNEAYFEKFVDIFKSAGIRSVTTVFMEVPCCHGLPWLVQKAMEKAGKSIPLEHIVLSVRGEIIKRERLVA